MKTIITLTLFIISSVSLMAQTPEDLKKMRTGKFTYTGQQGKVEIIRTETEQTEIYNDGKSKGILDINWINDSEYTLTLRLAENDPGCMKVGDVIKTKILNCDGTRYQYEASCESCGEDKNILIKIE